MKFSIRHLGRLAAISFLLWVLSAQPLCASVIVIGTRVVFPSDVRDITIKLENNGTAPALVQIWLDSGDPTISPETSIAPFVVSPPIARIDPNKSQILRLVYIGEGESVEKESLYWFNMLEIPPKPKEGGNYLQFAVRTRLKVFYRPAQLKSGPETSVPRIEWKVIRDGKAVFVQTFNPTPHYISLAQVALVAKDGSEYSTLPRTMLAPGATERIAFEQLDMPDVVFTAVRYKFINDFGALVDAEKNLNTE
jgi:chaperone protein EcpD